MFFTPKFYQPLRDFKTPPAIGQWEWRLYTCLAGTKNSFPFSAGRFLAPSGVLYIL